MPRIQTVLVRNRRRNPMQRATLLALHGVVFLAAVLLSEPSYSQPVLFTVSTDQGQAGGIRFKDIASGGAGTIVSGLDRPSGLAFDAAGNLYYGNHFNGYNLFKRTPDGATFSFGTVTPSLVGQTVSTYVFSVAVNNPGHIFYTTPLIRNTNGVIVQEGTVSMIDHVTGLANVVVPGLGNPAGLAFDSAGNLYFGDYTGAVGFTLCRMATNGLVDRLRVIAPSLTGEPARAFFFALAVDGNDDVFYTTPRYSVTQTKPGTISRFYHLSGDTIVVVDNLSNPAGVAFDTAGNLFYANHQTTGFVIHWRSPAGGGGSIGPLTAPLTVPTPYKFALAIPRAELKAVEVIQVVQNWTNGVPLVEGKTTYVRAHIRSLTGSRLPINGARLHARTTERLLGSVAPVDLSDDKRHYAEPEPDRSVWGHSVNFELRREWLKGTVELRLELPGVFFNEPPEAGGVRADGRVVVRFEPVAIPAVSFVAVRWADRAGNVYPPVSQGHLEGLRDQLIAIYPINDLYWKPRELDFTSGYRPDLTQQGLSWEDEKYRFLTHLNCELLLAERLSAVQGAITYGVLAGGRDLAGQANDIPGEVACGWSSLDPFDNTRNRHAHEISHVLGRHHAVGPDVVRGQRVGLCCEQAALSADLFPFSGPFASACGGNQSSSWTIGPMNDGAESLIFGLDTYAGNRVIAPSNHFELMSYCSQNYRWISSYTYTNIKQAINQRANSGSWPAAWHVVVCGVIDRLQNSVTLGPVLSVEAGFPAPPDVGTFSLQMSDGIGNVVREVFFEPDTQPGDAPGANDRFGSFVISVPLNPAAREISVLRQGQVLASRQATPNPPFVQITFPNGAEVLAEDAAVVRWQAADADGDTLSYAILFSADGGASWETLSANWPSNSFLVNSSLLRGTTNGLIRVLASDGFNSGQDDSDLPFKVPNHPPRITMLSPTENQRFSGAHEIVFHASSYDLEDSVLLESNVVWSSNRDGIIGTGTTVLREALLFAEGDHIVTVMATDSAGLSASTSVRVHITRVTPPDLLAKGFTPEGDFKMSLIGDPLVDHILQSSSDLRNWSPVSTNQIPRAGLMDLTDTNKSSIKPSFYRAVAFP